MITKFCLHYADTTEGFLLYGGDSVLGGSVLVCERGGFCPTPAEERGLVLGRLCPGVGLVLLSILTLM